MLDFGEGVLVLTTPNPLIQFIFIKISPPKWATIGTVYNPRKRDPSGLELGPFCQLMLFRGPVVIGPSIRGPVVGGPVVGGPVVGGPIVGGPVVIEPLKLI